MENSIVKKSIFKQRVYRRIFEVTCYNETPVIINYMSKIIKENNIHICDLEMPMLKIDEKFYIEELDRIVTITEAIRTSKENILYYIEEEFIEDEISIESKNEAERKVEEITEQKRKVIEEEKEKLEKARHQIQNKSFWSRLKDKMYE